MPRSVPISIREASMGWDSVNWGRSLSFFRESLGPDLNGMTAIEVGCGASSGGIGLWLSSEGVDVISTSILEVETEVGGFFAQCGLEETYSFEFWDATRPWNGEPVDLLCCKSIFGGIRRSDNEAALVQVLGEMSNALKTGGKILFVENLISSFLHQSLRRKYGAGKNSWYYFSIQELHRLLEDTGFSILSSSSTGFTGAFGRTESQKKLLGYLDGGLSKIIPKSLHYVGFGVAEKV